jgi:hypothetical protein
MKTPTPEPLRTEHLYAGEVVDPEDGLVWRFEKKV